MCKVSSWMLGGAILLIGIGYVADASAENKLQTPINNPAYQQRHVRGIKGKIGGNEARRNSYFSNSGQDYADFKNYLQKNYGFSYAVDVSYMMQYGAPNGKKAGFQTVFTPAITWENFNNEYGVGTLNIAYTTALYSGRNGDKIGNRIGAVTPINDYETASNSFDALYYTYQLPDKYKSITLALGQFPLYDFDGTPYLSSQQTSFLNYAMSQNATASYSTAGLGAYVQYNPNDDWSFTLGAQDASNIDGQSINSEHLFDNPHYTSFVSAVYTPNISGLGSGQYSILLYNQPWVKRQRQTSNGWSINATQNLGEKWAIFGRANGVSGSTEDIKRSYVIGTAVNNPFERNPLDQIGFAGAYNLLSEKAVGKNLEHKAETVLEAFLTLGISKWATITPDIQYYINPALNTKSDSATVMSLRANIFF